jgi:hypothetical protein
MTSFLSQISHSVSAVSAVSAFQPLSPLHLTQQKCNHCRGTKILKKNNKLFQCPYCFSPKMLMREKSGQEHNNDNAVDSFCAGAYKELTKGRSLGRDARSAGESTGRIVRESIEKIGKGVNENDDGGFSMHPRDVYQK